MSCLFFSCDNVTCYLMKKAFFLGKKKLKTKNCEWIQHFQPTGKRYFLVRAMCVTWHTVYDYGNILNDGLFDCYLNYFMFCFILELLIYHSVIIGNHLSYVESRGAGANPSWTSHQFITGLTHRDKQSFTLTFTHTSNLESPINLQVLDCGRKPLCWTWRSSPI